MRVTLCGSLKYLLNFSKIKILGCRLKDQKIWLPLHKFKLEHSSISGLLVLAERDVLAKIKNFPFNFDSLRKSWFLYHELHICGSTGGCFVYTDTVGDGACAYLSQSFKREPDTGIHSHSQDFLKSKSFVFAHKEGFMFFLYNIVFQKTSTYLVVSSCYFYLV